MDIDALQLDQVVKYASALPVVVVTIMAFNGFVVKKLIHLMMS